MSDPLDGLAGDVVHVWRARLTQPEDVVRTLEGHLSVEEARRADQYRRELDRTRYIVAHGALRELLATYTAQTPRTISCGHTAAGKPFLIDDRGECRLSFNLSHSGEWAVIALALSTEVGIDIEQIELDVSVDALAERFFSRNEFNALQAVPLEQRTVAFFSTWTRKEAYLKARGEGIADRLRNFSVSIDSEQAPLLLTDSTDPSAALRWRLYDLDIASGYAAALAADGTTRQIRIMSWTRDLLPNHDVNSRSSACP